jgi:hypothetical protein
VNAKEEAVWAAAYGSMFASIIAKYRETWHPDEAIKTHGDMAHTYSWRVADAAVAQLRKGEP